MNTVSLAPMASNDDMYAVSLSEAAWMVRQCMKSKKKVPSLIGPPGLGKSAIIHQIAAELKLFVIDLRLSTCEPPDLNGVLHINEKTRRGEYLPMEMFPLAGDTLPAGYRGWILFLDEAPQADPDVQKAMYKLVHDRMVGKYHLHEKCFVVLAGNSAQQSSASNEYSAPLKSRLIHIKVRIDRDEFLSHARKSGYDYRTTSYVEWRPENLYMFRPQNDQDTFACPRTYEFLSDLILDQNIEDRKWLPLIAGAIGTGIANEFHKFCGIHKSLPTIDQIIRDPTGINVPTEADILIAMAGSFGQQTTVATAPTLLKYIQRLGGEYQMIAMRDITERLPEVALLPEVIDWKIAISQRFFGK